MKVINRIVLLFILIIFIYGNIHVQYANDLSLSETIMQADKAVKSGDANTMNINQNTLKQSSAAIYNTLFALGVGIVVIIGAILGIKFIIASAEDRAQIKEMLIPYIIGSAVIFGAFTIWKITVSLLGQI